MATTTWRGSHAQRSLQAEWSVAAPAAQVTLIDPPPATPAITLDGTTTELQFTASATLTATAITAAGPADTIALGAATLTLGPAGSLRQLGGALAVTGAGTLDAAGALVIAGGTLDIMGGLAGSGRVTLGEGAVMSVGGTLAGDRSITIGADAALSVARLVGAATITLDDGATLTLRQATAARPTLALSDGAQSVVLPGTGALTPVVDRLHRGDRLDFVSLSSVPNGFNVGGAVVEGGTLYVAGAGGQDASVALTDPAAGLRFTASADGSGGTMIAVACFAAGTRIATEAGERPVEALRPGALVRTAAGALAPVRWVGCTRVDLAHHPQPARAAPIRVRAGAIAVAVPRRDLLLSPEHCLLIGGDLVPVHALANGATIARVDGLAAITYWHVELDRHDVLLAEGLAAESYLDSGNRGLFMGEAGVRALRPAFAVPPLQIWAERGCAPLRPCAPEARAALRARAAALGWRLTEQPRLTLVTKATSLAAKLTGDTWVALLPAGTTAVTLRSASFVPAELDAGSGDLRRLGVAVSAVLLDGRPLRERALAAGWHAATAAEAWRWTDGAARLALPALAQPSLLTVQMLSLGRYWQAPETAASKRKPGRAAYE